MTPRELPKATADDLIPADAQPRESDELRDQLTRHLARLLPEDGTGSEELRAYIQRFPQEELLLGEPKQLPRQDWIPADVTVYESLHVDIEKLFDSLGTLVDAIVGQAVFDDILNSLRSDPNGPQIDIRKELIAHLGSRLTLIAEDSPDPDGDLRLLVAVASTNTEKLAVGLERFLSSAPDTQRRTERGTALWQKVDVDGDVILAVCITHEHLLITHDARLLDKVLSATTRRQRR